MALADDPALLWVAVLRSSGALAVHRERQDKVSELAGGLYKDVRRTTLPGKPCAPVLRVIGSWMWGTSW